jgi:hypothetical protein
MYCKDCKLLCCNSCASHCHTGHKLKAVDDAVGRCECGFQTESSALSAPCLKMDEYWVHVHTNFMNFFDYYYVPLDISKIILHHLSGKDLLQLQRVNSALYMALNTKEAQEIWKMKLRKDFIWHLPPSANRPPSVRKAFRRIKSEFAHKPLSKTWRAWYIRRLSVHLRFSKNRNFVNQLTLAK